MIGKSILVGLLCVLGATASSAQILVDDIRKLSDSEGQLARGLDDEDLFGSSAASLGDLDGDGVADLAVGVPADDDGCPFSDADCNRGAVWILFLNADGTVRSNEKISTIAGNFEGTLDDGDFFGGSVANLGDLDGDGTTDLAVGAPTGLGFPDPFDDLESRSLGAVWILFLNADGTVKAHQKISNPKGERDDGFGQSDFDEFGSSVANLGDLDGDGVIDLAVGAPHDDVECDTFPFSNCERGAVWILFLNADGTVKTPQKIINPNEGEEADFDFFGGSVANLDDLDGDGVTDLAVGADGDDDGGIGGGAVWVLFLNADGTVKTPQKIINPNEGEEAGFDSFGGSVANLGDLDGDGVTDLAVGAPLDASEDIGRGAVWVLFLNPDGTAKAQQKISDAEVDFSGERSGEDFFGSSVAGLSDLDGDGVTDLAVGAPNDDGGGRLRGAVWVLFLNDDGTVKTPQKISDTEVDFSGELADFDRFGSSVAGLSDLDGDGVIELAVGAPFDSLKGASLGAVWILFLNADGTVKASRKISNPDEGEEADGDRFGASVANLGDLDGDGVTDLAVGVPEDDGGGRLRGAVWVLFLNPSGTVKDRQKISNPEDDESDEADFHQFGSSVTSLGDLDDDGVTDLAVGVPGAGGSRQGAVWVLFLNPDGTVKGRQKVGKFDGNFSGELLQFDHFGSSVASLGDLDDDGATDLAVGAPGGPGFFPRGAVWVLFLNPGGTVKDQQKISDFDGNFSGELDALDRFGDSVAGLGDFDEDGVPDLVVSAPDDDDGCSPSEPDCNRGGVWVLFLNEDGMVKAHQKISDIDGNFSGELDNEDEFGASVANLGDFNGDEVPDLAVGARGDDDGGENRGALWMLFMLRNQVPVVENPIPDVPLAQQGRNFEKNLNTVFTDPDDERLNYTALSEDLAKALAFISADSTLVVTLTTPEVGDSVEVMVSARDSLGLRVSTSFIVRVDEKPAMDVVVQSPIEPVAGEPLALSVKITDNIAVQAGILLYRQGGGAGRLDALTVTDPPTAPTYTFEVPGSALTDRGLEYVVLGVDNNCFATVSSVGSAEFIAIRSEGAQKTEAQPANAYHLLSVPLNLEAKSPAAVLEDDLGGYDKTVWRFFEVTPDFRFVEFPDTDNMTPGKAFLLRVKDAGRTITTGPGTSISTIEEYPIALEPGWNFIGNPFNFDILTGSLRLQNRDDRDPPVLRFFDGASWNDPASDPVSTIEPFEGYAVHVDSADVLFINPDALPFEEAALDALEAVTALGCPVEPFLELFPPPQKNEPASEEPVAWSIRVLAQSGPARDIDTRAAVAANASAAWDRLDRPEPPGFGDHVSVYFSHPEWQRNTTRYSIDTRPEPTDSVVWPLEVAATVRDKVHLTFEGLADVPPEFEVRLLDDLLSRSQNLRETPTYAVAGTTDPRSLKLVVGKPGFLDGERAESGEIPERFELFPNFPNPFNPSTTIRYGLPVAERVSLVIYNALGEKVATLAAGSEKAAGYHAEVWDGHNAAGAQVASGVYFARLRAGRFVQTQTMVLVK